MSFINKCSTIIRRSSKDMFSFHSDESLFYNYFDSSGNLEFKNNILDSTIDFANCYFTLGDDDSLYGIFKDKGLKMIEIKKDSKDFNQYDILTYDYEKFDLLFPYIKKIDNTIHIFYYVYNNGSTNTCALFHHYYHNNVWIENKIDFINHIVIDKYSVLWIKDSPIVFYLNLVDGYEEVFLSRFNLGTLTWSNPIQLTSSKKNKIYLSVLKDNMNFYHFTFCENVENGYCVKYLNGYLNDNFLDVNISTYITGPSACMYPNLLKHNSDLYLMWVNYGRLHTSISNDIGKNWSEHEVDEYSVEEDFSRSMFFSNYKDDLDYNISNVFTSTDDIGLLGF